MATVEFDTVLAQDDGSNATGIYLPFDPKEVFGRARAPVKVTINGAMYRTTTAPYGGDFLIPVRREVRDAAGIVAGDRIHVVMELDDQPRTVEVPDDLAEALAADPEARTRFDALSFTHRKEYVNSVIDAKRPETRARRIERTVEQLGQEARAKGR
jgi:bacteriocin resistance YdeI/OmpD-like protein/uncharacterized protein DUF1905